MEHICHTKKCIFIHVPKSAGISIAISLGWDRKVYGGHYRAVELRQALSITTGLNRDVWDKYFKFSFCRNPIDRIASAYGYFINSKTFKKQNVDNKVFEAINNSSDFNDFCSNFLSKSNPLELIDHLKPQHHFLCDEEDNILVDFLGRFEFLERDFKSIASRLGVKASLPHENKGTTRKTDYINEESKDILKRLYKKDFKIFNYEL